MGGTPNEYGIARTAVAYYALGVMESPTEVPTKRVVLEGIGRNVLNLQKMEGMFKSLAAFSEFEGPLPDLPRILEDRRAVISKKSLGQLVGEFVARLRTEEPEELDDPAKADEPMMTFRFTIVESEEDILRLSESLKTFVEERNQLTHQKLLNFDIESEDACMSLVQELDEQHRRIVPAYQHLQTRVNALNEMKAHALAELEVVGKDLLQKRIAFSDPLADILGDLDLEE